MSNKTLTLSIVIPVYNEQSYLKACLDSIAAQTDQPLEVIVVDNNSSDGTVALAKTYKFVRILHEPRQHQTFAQIAGFNSAKGDIIGRIDADSILPADWIKNVKKHFSDDPALAGITGGTIPYDMAAKTASAWVFSLYIGFAGRLAGTRMLWGANCALRRSAWQKIKDQPLRRSDIWEDFDLSFCVAQVGAIHLVDDIKVGSSFRAIHKGLFTQTNYQFRAIRTFYLRRGWLGGASLLMVWSTMYVAFLLIQFDRFILRPIAGFLGLAKKTSEVSSDIVPLQAE